MLNIISIAQLATRPAHMRPAVPWLAAFVLIGAGGIATAQDTETVAGIAIEYSDEELETLVGPIALYPDDLVAIVLPASTYPLQIVQAARLLDDLEDNPSLEPDPNWDNAVVALLNYPEVLRLMNEDLDWTWALGEAVLAEQASVLDAIQDFRDQAYAAGNLQSDDRQIVNRNDEVIAIEPADPEVIYVPYYEPERVVVRQHVPVYHYYSVPYPVYYYPYPVGYHFRTGPFWGVTSAFSIGWYTHYLNVHHHSHIGHPYYNRSYYTPYYARRGVNININLNHESHVWRPTHRHGARPDRQIAVSRGGYTRSRDGQVRSGATRSVTTGDRSVNRRELRGVRDPGLERDGRVTRNPRASSRVENPRTRSNTAQQRTQLGARPGRSDDGAGQARARAERAAERAWALRGTGGGANRLRDRSAPGPNASERGARTPTPARAPATAERSTNRRSSGSRRTTNRREIRSAAPQASIRASSPRTGSRANVDRRTTRDVRGIGSVRSTAPRRTNAPVVRRAPQSSSASRADRGSGRSGTVSAPRTTRSASSRNTGGMARTTRSAPSQRSVRSPQSSRQSSATGGQARTRSRQR